MHTALRPIGQLHLDRGGLLPTSSPLLKPRRSETRRTSFMAFTTSPTGWLRGKSLRLTTAPSPSLLLATPPGAMPPKSRPPAPKLLVEAASAACRAASLRSSASRAASLARSTSLIKEGDADNYRYPALAKQTARQSIPVTLTSITPLSLMTAAHLRDAARETAFPPSFPGRHEERWRIASKAASPTSPEERRGMLRAW